MAFGRHLKALLWKNALLWRRRLCGSLCEIIFPIIMVLSLAGIRKAVSNEDFAAGNRLANGVSYIDDNKGQAFLADLASSIDFEIGPLNYPMRPANGRWYTIVGEDPERVRNMKDKLEDVLNELRKNIDYFQIEYQDGFKTQEDLFDFVRGREYQKDEKQDAFLFAIGLPPDRNADPFNYTIYMSENYPKNIADTKQDLKSLVPGVDNFEAYSVYGYMSLQSFIANYILHDELGDDGSSIDVFMSMGSIDDFTQDKFLEVSGGLLALFILLIFIAPLFRLVSFLTEEKASRAREGMKIMGLNDSPYWLSWFIYYFCVNLVISIFTGVCFGLILYPKSNIFLIWLYIFLYGLSLFSFAVLVSSFLQRPLIACIVVTLFHFLTYFLSTPIAQPDVGLGVRIIFSMIPNVAMVLSSVAIGQMEATGQGLSGSNLFEEIFTYYIGVAFISFILNFVVQLLLGLYLDNVLPKQYGKRQHPCFMFQKSYWFGTKYNDADGDQQRLLSEDEDDSEINGHHQDFEAVPPNVRQLERTGDCMKVRHLKKVYGDGKVAVNDLSLTMYKNQIFALLGHNGAGKTTTLSILTGLYQPTAGKASVFNLDMFGQVNEVRKNLGVCPQFDILFDMLTPEEHLKLYCMFKGVPVNEVEEQVEKTLKDVDLESKRKAFAKNLSGGQKRKLSVGIAMIGGSKLVLLDEPTSGMDLTARRKIWDMLKNNKQDRILILTTHFMDEADILGDRIAIMASGKIKCCGESLFLKKRFGVGYNLIIAKEDKEPNPAIEEFVFSRIENCIKLSEVSSEVTFQIPQSESAKFEEFFIELDNSLRQLRIKSYGVGVTTLEEVFLKVGHQDEEEAESNSPDQFNHEEEKLNRRATNGINDGSELELDDYSIAEQHEKSVFFLHYYALCVKRFLVSFRQLKTSLFEILIPMIFIVTGLGLANIDFFSDAKPFNLDYSAFPSKNTKYITSATPNDPNLAAYIATLDADAFEISNVDTPTGANIGEKLTNFEKNIFEEKKGYDKEVKNAGNQILYNLDRTAQAQR